MNTILLMITTVCLVFTPFVTIGSAQDQRPPAVGQTLIREGDVAIKLTEMLKMGTARSEAEAENTLASIGVAPQNGWIADYPVTPDIIGELQNALSGAIDSGKLAMNKDEAMQGFQQLLAQQGLPVRPDFRNQYAGVDQPPDGVAPPQDYPEYYEPAEIDDYYSDQGPPIVTYYPPPWDYDYLYAWVPYPFWSGGFWFPGFFCLHDFHRAFFFNGHRSFISNHFWDAGGRRFGTIDPARRHMGGSMANISHPGGRFASHAASSGASSILRRSFDRAAVQHSGGTFGNRAGASQSNFRGGPGGVTSSRGYRSPSAGYSSGTRVPSGHTSYGARYGASLSHPGSFSRPGMARSFASSSGAGGFGSHGSAFGSRAFSRAGSGGGRAFSGGSSFGSHSGGFGGRGFSGGGRGFSGGHRSGRGRR